DFAAVVEEDARLPLEERVGHARLLADGDAIDVIAPFRLGAGDDDARPLAAPGAVRHHPGIAAEHRRPHLVVDRAGPIVDHDRPSLVDADPADHGPTVAAERHQLAA